MAHNIPFRNNSSRKKKSLTYTNHLKVNTNCEAFSQPSILKKTNPLNYAYSTMTKKSPELLSCFLVYLIYPRKKNTF